MPVPLAAAIAVCASLAHVFAAAQERPGLPEISRSLRVVDVEAFGTIQVVEPDGRRTAPLRGRIELWERYHCTWRLVEVPIVQGRWHARVRRPVAWAVVGRVVVDGREAYVDGGGWDSEPASCAWTARLVQPVHLTVLDASNGEPVRDFEVREPVDHWPPGVSVAIPPFDAAEGWVVAPGASGRVPLPAWSLDPDPEPLSGHGWNALRTFWVRAPGRAWTRVRADFARGGDVVARLAVGASLEVAMASSTRDLLRGRMPWFELELADASVWRRSPTCPRRS